MEALTLTNRYGSWPVGHKKEASGGQAVESLQKTDGSKVFSREEARDGVVIRKRGSYYYMKKFCLYNHGLNF